MLDFLIVGIRWRWFLANMLPLSFKISDDDGRLIWLTTMPFLSQGFWSLVLFLEQFQAVYIFRWVTVYFSVMVLWVKSISEGEVVLNLWANNFSAGELPFWSGCEFRDRVARKWSSELSFALLRVHLTVWMDLSSKPFDWW